MLVLNSLLLPILATLILPTLFEKRKVLLSVLIFTGLTLIQFLVNIELSFSFLRAVGISSLTFFGGYFYLMVLKRHNYKYSTVENKWIKKQ